MNPPQRRVVDLPLDLIDDSERLRPVDEAYALLIAESIEQRGLDTPVHVSAPDTRGKHRLIAGAHRKRAMELLGRRTIPALVVDADALQARLIEVDENLMRRELNPLERGGFLAERRRLHQELHGEGRGGDRKSVRYQSDILSSWSPRFTEDAARRTGLSPREVQRSIARYSGLPEDVRATVARMWIAGSTVALDALRRLPADTQRVVVAEVQARGSTDLTDAIARATGRERAAPPSDFDRFLALWRRMDRRTQARVRRHVNQTAETGDES